MDCSPVYKAVDNSMKEDEIRYEVFIDHDNLQMILDRAGAFDLGDDFANEEYRQQFLHEEIFSFGVVAKKLCKCCCEWSEKDSLWGIHAQSAQEAIKLFKDQ